MNPSAKHRLLIHLRQANEARARICLYDLYRIAKPLECDARAARCSDCPLNFDGVCLRDAIVFRAEEEAK